VIAPAPRRTGHEREDTNENRQRDVGSQASPPIDIGDPADQPCRF
jgi:hypothetical protein